MLKQWLIEMNLPRIQDLLCKVLVNLVNYRHECVRQRDNMLSKWNLEAFDMFFNGNFEVVLPPIFTTDARVILEADVPSDS